MYAGGHWTLLVFVRSGGTDFQIYSENFVEVRYYDSAAAFSDGCWEIAEQVIKFLLPKITPSKIRRNCSFQVDGHSCGVYLLHYWEGEVRQFLGQGWVVGKPSSKIIGHLKDKLVKISWELQQFLEAPQGDPEEEQVQVPRGH